MPYTDHGQMEPAPGVPYQPVPLECGDMKPPRPVLMHGARTAKAEQRKDWEDASEAAEIVNEGIKRALEVQGRQHAEDIDRLRQAVYDLTTALTAAKDGVAQEREACARMCDHLAATFTAAAKGPIQAYLLDQFARSIRARG